MCIYELELKEMVTMDTIIRTYIIFVSYICYLNLFKSNILGGPTIANNSSNDPCNFMDLNDYLEQQHKITAF